ncbi:MMPL family transporter [Phytomonospora sp. NPDC050363]|uniref:MMPL family transporter n=1 Tax=Phytomonospora sp. NPDC050363 TaxID=3155642 RepID=UPI0033F4D1F8
MASFLYRLGRAAFHRRWLVLIIWLVAVAGISVGAVASGLKMTDAFTIPGTDSARAQEILEEKFGRVAGGGDDHDETAPASSRIVVQAPEGVDFTTGDGLPAVLGAVAPLGDAADVVEVSDPVESQAIAPDGSVLYVDVQFGGPAKDVDAGTKDAMEAIADTLEDSGYTVALSGGPFKAALEILSPTEAIGVLIALIVLVVTFGSLLAAGMPLLTALLGVGIGVGGVLSLSAVVEISSATLTLALMLGLAVGIDYALFLLSRHRQQLATGMDPAESTGRAVGTAGSAIVFAGLTVVIALAGLAVTGIPFLAIMGLAAAATVAVAVLVAVTLVPAILGFAGKRLVPRGRAARTAERVHSADNRWGHWVTAHPVVTLLLGVIFLGAIAAPVVSMRLGLPDKGSEAEESGDRQAYDMLAEGFGPGINGPLVVLVDGDAGDPQGLGAAMVATQTAIDDLPGTAYVAPPMPNGTPDANGLPTMNGASAALIYVLPETGPNEEATADLVHAVRGLEAGAGTTVWVTGSAAANIDVTEKLENALPVFLAIVVGLALILLLIAFRSLLVPLTAALGFLLTVAAAFGATTAVYQWGWLSDVFNVTATGPLLSFMPVLLVGILFGLAMDYQVFLVSRMREDYVHGLATDDPPLKSVRSGYAHGVRVVLAAALIMVAVFSSFVFSGSAVMAPIAFAMGLGVAIDALVVRMTMIPAVMALLGRSAWWLPRWLDRILPNVDIEGASLERRADVEPERVDARV